MDTSWTRSDYSCSCEAQALKQSVQHHPPTVTHNAKYLGASVIEPKPMDIDVDAEDSRPLKRARWDEDEGETLARWLRILEVEAQGDGLAHRHVLPVEGDHVHHHRGARNTNCTPSAEIENDNPEMIAEDLQEAREYAYDADDDEGYISGFETKVGSGDELENEIYLEDSSYRRPREDETRHYHISYGDEGLERISNFKAEGQMSAEPGWDRCDLDARLAAILTDGHRHVFYSFDDAGFEI